MLVAREKLHPLLKTSKDSSLWRHDEKNFHPEGQHPQGLVDLSPRWFQQDHDVSILAHELYSLAAHFKSGDVATTPAVSANFREPAALDWLDCISESNAVLSAILAIIHPKLHDAGQLTAKRLRDTPGIHPQDVLCRWVSVFNGVSVISNRSTPSHQDGSSRNNWFDILAALCSYQGCNLELPGLGFLWSTAPAQWWAYQEGC